MSGAFTWSITKKKISSFKWELFPFSWKLNFTQIGASISRIQREMKENGSDISKIFMQKKWKAKNGAPEREGKLTSPAWQPAPAACWPASSARPFLHPKPQSEANHRYPQEAPTAAGNSAPEISQWINDLAEARRSDHSDLPAKAKSKRGRMWGDRKRRIGTGEERTKTTVTKHTF